MNELYFIRHGKTAGNEQKRYIGRTDEPLSALGRAELAEKDAPFAEIVAVSPLVRCVESAKILYPHAKQFVVNGFRECDFGDFEGKNYAELSDNADYQEWIDSNGTLPFPHGEQPLAFRARCVEAFGDFANTLRNGQSAALVVHGGTIMAVMERFAETDSPRGFYDWQPENFGGWAACTTRELWRDRRVLTGVRKLGEGAADA